MTSGKNCVVRVVSTALAVGYALAAEAQGLSRATSALNNLRSQLLTIVPIVAVIALILLGIGYATRMVHKETFVSWVVGVIIVGSATEIVTMFIG
jgi:type IV secretory pathway VirB2 component (pilin)